MSGYPPPGPPYYGHYPPPPPHYPPPPRHFPPPPHHPTPPHIPPGSFTYLPPTYQYQPQPQWQQTQTQQPPEQQLPAQQAYPHPPIVVEQPTVIAGATPEPILSPVEDIVSWIPATPTTAQELDYKAVVGGKEGYDSSPLWVIRAHHKGELIPGKLAIKHRYAYIPSAGMEVPVHNFEVLCAKPSTIQWVPAKDGKVPAGAIVAGNTLNAESLYIGRVPHKSSITPGKVQPSQNCCYISYGGKEISFRKYEVLCQII